MPDARPRRAPMLGIGIDLGGTSARAAVVDGQGRVLSLVKKLHGSAEPVKIADLLATLAAEAVAGAKLVPSDIGAVGVGLAGQIHSGTGVVAVGPNLGWREVPFGKMLAERLSWPCFIMNDLSAAAWGERSVGAGEGQDDVCLVFVGSGVGGGLILGGELYEGSTGVAGEIGHTKVVPDGRLCGCGEHGCLEAYCGGHNLSAQVAEAIAAGRRTSLEPLAAGGRRVTAGEIEKAALEGDALARGLWETCFRYLSVAIANLATVLNPSRLILGGGVLLTSPVLKQRVREEARRLTLAAARGNLKIVDATLGDDSGVVGAALRATSSLAPAAGGAR